MDPSMRSVTKGFFCGMAAPTKMVHLLPILDDMAMIICNRHVSAYLEGTIFETFDGNIHGILLNF